uniref:Recep_L_domain domain-containing protein n=1 Tax=Caenorhabditis japonica TaxID=281687 RepID=A0A8R1HMS5_CAEJA
MARISIVLLLVILSQLAIIVDAQRPRSRHLYRCTNQQLNEARIKLNKTKLQWPSFCKVFQGTLVLNLVDLNTADFRELKRIEGRLVVVGTRLVKMPYMPRLTKIMAFTGGPGLVILNNPLLRDLRGLTHWSRQLFVGETKMPVMISGNPYLDTVNYPRMFHRPYAPVSCEKRLSPQYDAEFAEGKSLMSVIIIFVIIVTVFLYPLSMGNTNVYFAPGYHKF